MSIIRFFVEDTKFSLPEKPLLKKWIIKTIKEEGLLFSELCYIFCSDRYLLQMNQDFLHHDTLTDIITFDTSEKNNNIEGEIYISIERVKENADTLNESFYRELHRVLIHGVLHLCGYKDKTNMEQTLMRMKENHYLELLKKMDKS
ncbi:MAG: rRNA maturation RNase YbeY [Cyclobacteriaceae bacterium]